MPGELDPVYKKLNDLEEINLNLLERIKELEKCVECLKNTVSYLEEYDYLSHGRRK